jgi:hypothetical protein
MESSWPTVVKNPTGNKPMDDFAVIIELTPEIGRLVFRRSVSYFAVPNNSSYEETGKANRQDRIPNPHIIKSLF